MRSLQALEGALGLIRQGLSARQAACRMGVSPSTLLRWAKLAGMELQKGRLGGLAESRPRKGRPRAEAPAGPFRDGNGRLDLAGRLLI
jgi:transposase-like protein